MKHGLYFIASFSKCRSNAHVTYSIVVTIIVFMAFVLYIRSIVADQKMSVDSRPHVFEVSLMRHMQDRDTTARVSNLRLCIFCWNLRSAWNSASGLPLGRGGVTKWTPSIPCKDHY